jgi:hypothetical protein
MRAAGLALVLALAACGGGDDMMAAEGFAVKNVMPTSLSGRSSGATHKVWACLTWDPAGAQQGATHEVTVGCGVILPDETE